MNKSLLAISVCALAFTIFSLPAIAEGTIRDSLPEWTKRVDVNIGLQEHSKPEWEIETIQPLHENENSVFFVQGRVAHRNSDQTYNIGSGYRYILDDKSLMFGVNSFYDRTADNGHARIGLGGEIFGSYGTFRTNYYNAISGLKTVNSSGGISTTEQALDGWDVSLETIIPYVPWANLSLTAFEWQGDTVADLQGYTFGLRMQLMDNLEVNTGITDDDKSDTEGFLKMTWRFGKPKYVEYTAFDSGLFSSEAITKVNVEKHKLEKVRRHNDIVVERSTGGGAGIIIGRGT